MSSSKWLDDLKPGDQVIVHHTKASLVELQRMIAYVERVGDRGSVVVKFPSALKQAFVRGRDDVVSAYLEPWTAEAAAQIDEVVRVAKLIRLVHKRMRDLDFVRRLPLETLDMIATLTEAKK